jgi:Flp pilus assembly pilin Flp
MMNIVVLWMEGLRARLGGERGAGLAEYALLLFVVAVAAATVLTAFGDDIIDAFNAAITALPSGAP